MYHSSRYAIGIDLGTTNIALSYVDTASGAADKLEIFPITQLVAPGELRAEKIFPAACYLAERALLPPGALDLPWSSTADKALGLYAKNDGALIPSRYIASSKSWLCHAGVNRRAAILPWGFPEAARKLSPLEVTCVYLCHIRDAWNHRFGAVRDADGETCVIESQQVVITIPAGFDETARELTLEAAAQAGFKHVSLLEEPLAAFYSWLNRNQDKWQEELAPGESVLIVDVGGGTSDFSIVALDEHGVLSRTAAGEHLLLGGDNIDIALAKKIEQEWNTHLPPADWAALCSRVREVKEKLLESPDIDELPVTILSQGSSVIGGSRKAMLSKSALLELIYDGFLPEIDVQTPSPAKRSGIQTMGLPYAADPAITRHLLAFLRYAARVAGGDGLTPLRPDRILFNGGSMIPSDIRRRVADAVSGLFPDNKPVKQLRTRDLNLAVAYGAASYALSCRGVGVRVKSGTSRAYYLEVSGEAGTRCYLCVMPRGTDEGIVVRNERKFQLETNRTAEFPLYSSSTRVGDAAGTLLDDATELTPVSSLICVLRFGKHEKRMLETGVSCQLSETGVLKLAVESLSTSHQWPLHFDTRLIRDDDDPLVAGQTAIVIDQQQTDAAKQLIHDAFAANKVNSLARDLENILGEKRKDWPLSLLRELADALMDMPYASLLRKPETESRWLNLCGFCLRPGFGDPADELRLEKAWKLWYQGMNNPDHTQTAAEWRVFWRRLAPGLRAGHQRTVFQELMKHICLRGEYNPRAGSPQEKTEMWRCAGALELLPVDNKVSLGKILLKRGKRLEDAEYWVLGRLGARKLFRAPVNHVVPAAIAGKWLDKLIEENPGKAEPQLLFAVSRIAGKCGDRGLDILPEQRERARTFLVEHKVPAHWISHLDSVSEPDSADEQSRVLGDSIPLGLKFIGA